MLCPGLVSRASRQLLSFIGGSGKAAEDMRPRNMAKFNDIYQNKADIRYYSVMSKFEPSMSHLFVCVASFSLTMTTKLISWMTSVPHKIIRDGKGSDYEDYPEAYGPNDGMVAVKSAKWASHSVLGVV